jgi:hypothetical protein
MTVMTEQISIRLASVADAPALARLAALDSARVPDGSVLLAERDGVVAAALALESGSVIADPFQLTEELVAMLRLRAARPARRRTWLPIIRRTDAHPAR